MKNQIVIFILYTWGKTMLEILDPRSDISRGGRAHVKLSNLIGKQMVSVLEAVLYYQKASNFMPSTNIFYRLTELFDFGDVTQMGAYNKASEELRDICLMAGVCHEDYQGNVFKSTMNYSEGHALLYIKDSNAAEIISRGWKDLKPVSILYRDGVNATLELPLETSSEIDGFCLFGVDIPAYAAMYYGWQIENTAKKEGDRESRIDFITRYVLAPTIVDSNRLAFMNMMNMDITRADIKKGSNVPFFHNDNMPNIFNELIKILQVNGSQSIHHSNFMEEYPGFDVPSIYDIFPKLDNTLTTNNNHWAKLLAGIQIVKPVLTMTPKHSDKDALLRFRVLNRTVSGQRVISKAPTEKLTKHIQTKYDSVRKLLEK